MIPRLSDTQLFSTAQPRVGGEKDGSATSLVQSATLAFIAIVVGPVLSVAVRQALLVSMGRSAGSGALSGFDPGLFVALPGTLLLVTMLAAAIPARRASRIDPQGTTAGVGDV